MTTPGNTSSNRIRIDGSKGEGGGQILRNAIALAGLLRKSIEICKVRANRAQPGLKAQHATGLQLVTDICGGSLQGASIGSTDIRYEPLESTETTSDDVFRGEIKTAGSICLLLQAALPCALFRTEPCRLVLKGGTNATLAPQYDYWEQVFWPVLRDQCGLAPDQLHSQVIQRGYFPKGGGVVFVDVKPLKQHLKPLNLTERGTIHVISIRSFHAGKVPRSLAQRMAEAARNRLLEEVRGLRSSQIQCVVVAEPRSVGSGLGILVVAETTSGCRLAGSTLCESTHVPETAGVRAADELIASINEGGCVDEWLQDQLIVFMALAEGRSEIVTGSLTLHTQTAITIVEKLTGVSFQVANLAENATTRDSHRQNTDYGQEGRIPGKHRLCCDGIGYFRLR